MAPFTGACSAVDSSIVKLGVVCKGTELHTEATCTSPLVWTPNWDNSSVHAWQSPAPLANQLVAIDATSQELGVLSGNSCSDPSKATETDCEAIVEVTSDAPLADTDANYVTKTECKAYNDALGYEWKGALLRRPWGLVRGGRVFAVVWLVM